MTALAQPERFEEDVAVRESLRDEVVRLLSEYIRIDTSNPPGNVQGAVSFLTRVFRENGIEHEVIESAPGKTNILARVRGDGSSGKPLLFLNHMDVVPANAAEWSFDPFSGEVRDGYVLGRGTLDMKGMGIAQMLCMLAVHRERKRRPLRRDLVFLAVCDEETGGFEGAKRLVEKQFEKLDPAVVLDEGGFGFEGVTRVGPTFFVARGQKKGIWIRLTARGRGGHGSQPTQDNPNDLLARAIHRIITHPWPVDASEAVWLPLRRLAKMRGWVESIAASLHRLAPMRALLGRYLRRHPLLDALVRDTATVTMLESGTKVNVIPSTATAVIDLRILPHHDAHDAIERLKAIIGDSRVSVEILRELYDAATSDSESEFLTVLEGALRSRLGTETLLPYITPVGTDAKYFRAVGVPAYGLFPIIITPQDLRAVHGVDEKISIDNLLLATTTFLEVVKGYC